MIENLSAKKHGVIRLTKSTALEYAARGVRIKTACPGMMGYWASIPTSFVRAAHPGGIEADFGRVGMPGSKAVHSSVVTATARNAPACIDNAPAVDMRSLPKSGHELEAMPAAAFRVDLRLPAGKGDRRY